MTKASHLIRTHLHSCMVNDIGTGEDALVVSEIVEDPETGEIKPNLRIFKSPSVPYWITQPVYQDHTEKKELEDVKKLDRFTALNKHKDREIFRQLNNLSYTPNFLTRNQRREIMQSPFLYGGNISVEAHAIINYRRNLEKQGRTPHTPTTGFLDIEQSLLPSSLGKIPLIVLTVENQVYLAMMASFMYEEVDGKMVKVSVDDVRQAAHEHIDSLVESIFKENKELKDFRSKVPFHYNFFVGEDEVEMIKWIFEKAHESQVSFIGVWNLGFDIPEIIKVLKDNGIPLKDVFVHPKLRDTGYAHVSYREDKRDVQHFTQKWHWLSATAHFQFVDSMALYSYIRTVDGKESSYALDDILQKFDLGGKLKIAKVDELKHLQTADWHRAMLSRFFIEYAVYAMWDAIGLQILEWRNSDMTTLLVSSGSTPLKFFPNQTIRVTTTMFEEWLPKGRVLGTGVDVEAKRDDDLLTAGGAVLEPQHFIAEGIKPFLEWPDHATKCVAWCNDVDFSAQYPTAISTMNISRQTKTATIFAVKGDHVKYKPDEGIEVLCSYLVTPTSSGVEMGSEFFGLPTYGQMQDLFENRHKQKDAA